MRLLIIRHADPDYSIDSLTQLGFKQAKALGKYLKGVQIDEAYVSPLGRAQDTARLGLKYKNIKPITLKWLREFDSTIPFPDGRKNTWDWQVNEWSSSEESYSIDTWLNQELISKSPNIKELYKERIDGLDELLAKHGYIRDGRNYKVIKESHETIALFCHFGVECIFLAHLLHISPILLWHHFVATPSSVTIINTEERKQGLASWRVSCFGDLSHLHKYNVDEAFAARYCECYSDPTRH